MADASLFSLLSDQGKAAYNNLLDRPENSGGGGDVGASIRWPSPLYATDDHYIVAQEMARVLGGNQYDHAYIAQRGGNADWPQVKSSDKASFESWAQDYSQRADQLAGLPPGSNPDSPAVRQAVQDFYAGVWPGVGFPVPNEAQEPGYERDASGRVYTFKEWAGGTTTDTTYDLADQFDWSREIKRIHPDGLFEEVTVGDDGNVSSLVSSGGTFTAGDLAGVFGSNIGRILGSNSLVGQVAAGTIIGSIGKEIGIALQYGTEFSFDSVVNGGLHQQNSQLGGLAGGAIGSLSSILFAELGQALHLDGFGNGLFQAVGSTVTTQLLTNVYNVTVLNQPASGLFNGFGADQFAFNIAGAISNAVLNQLAGEIVRPLTTEAAIGGSIGSSVGAYIGTVLIPIPVLGSAIGAFIGRIAGTLFPISPRTGRPRSATSASTRRPAS